MDEAISRAIDYLTHQQQPEGNFLSLSSTNQHNFLKAKTYHSNFSSFLILSSLNALSPDKRVSEIRQKLASFILTQKSSSWSFNYWVKGSHESLKMPYPDDLDDTFSALSALFQYNPKIVEGKALGKIIPLLTTLELEEGGPYRTWLVDDASGSKWRDVDLAVNSNIAYFLSLQKVTLPKLKKFTEQNIEKDTLTSPYYPSVYPIIYFISRFYKGRHSEKLKADILKKKQNNNWGNPLDTALAVSSLINLKINPGKISDSISYLIKTQTKGCWKTTAFCLDPVGNGSTYYCGSPSLTSAFCLEALAKYQNVTLPVRKKANTETQANNKIHREIVKRVRERLDKLDRPVRDQALKSLSSTLKGDETHQITLLPMIFKNSLGDKGVTVNRELLLNLGEANWYGWGAYTIYDNLLDETTQPTLLPIANIFLRQLTSIFENLAGESEISDVFHQMLDKIESTNFWEINNCRLKVENGQIKFAKSELPDYGNYDNLFFRSCGHALGPITILISMGFKQDSTEVTNLTSFFRDYIIAKQLTDDAHDFFEDLSAGNLTVPVVEVLKRLAEQDTHISLSLESDKQAIQKIYWYKVINIICRDILKHIALARASLKKLSLIKEAGYFNKMLELVENSAEKALKEQKETLKFLKTFS